MFLSIFIVCLKTISLEVTFSACCIIFCLRFCLKQTVFAFTFLERRIYIYICFYSQYCVVTWTLLNCMQHSTHHWYQVPGSTTIWTSYSDIGFLYWHSFLDGKTKNTLKWARVTSYHILSHILKYRLVLQKFVYILVYHLAQLQNNTFIY